MPYTVTSFKIDRQRQTWHGTNDLTKRVEGTLFLNDPENCLG